MYFDLHAQILLFKQWVIAFTVGLLLASTLPVHAEHPIPLDSKTDGWYAFILGMSIIQTEGEACGTPGAAEFDKRSLAMIHESKSFNIAQKDTLLMFYEMQRKKSHEYYASGFEPDCEQ